MYVVEELIVELWQAQQPRAQDRIAHYLAAMTGVRCMYREELQKVTHVVEIVLRLRILK